MSIGYANICSSVHDHRQKVSVFKIKHRFWKNKWRAMNFTKRKLVLRERLWTKEVLKIIRSTLIRSTLTRSWRHQKLKIISSLRLKLKFIESCHFIWISMKKEPNLIWILKKFFVSEISTIFRIYERIRHNMATKLTINKGWN